jgi:PAS domain S-box-containing protein
MDDEPQIPSSAAEPPGSPQREAAAPISQLDADCLRRLRQLINLLPNLVSYVDAQQRYRLNNAAYARWFGDSVESYQGRQLREVVGEAAYEKIRPHVEAALAGERRVFEDQIPYQDAGLHIVQAEYVPDRNEQGEVVGFFALITDLTESRRAAQELRASEQRFRATFEQAAVGMAHIGMDGRWLRVNHKLCDILGYSCDELLQRSCQDITYHEDLTADLTPVTQLFAGEIPSHSMEKRYVRKDGTLVWAALTVALVRADSPEGDYYIAVVEDVSERKYAEETLRREHEFRERLIDTAQAIILVLDSAGRIVRFNRFMEELSGYALSEVQGKSWFETFLPERERERIRQLFGAAISGVPTRGNINSIVTKDGRERLIEWFDAPLTDAYGNTTHLLCTGHDLTDRQELQEQLLTIAEKEQARIGLDLHDDVGQELTGLALTAQTLADSLGEQDVAEAKWAASLVGGVERTLRKVRALSRGLIPVEVDARGLMSALADLAARASELGGPVCEFQCERPAPVEDNRTATQLYRIAQEAVGNALRHAGAQHIWIVLEAQPGSITLIVRDDGVGIDAGNGGRGMGLRIMRYRAETIGASLQIHSTPAGGAEVRCSIV